MKRRELLRIDNRNILKTDYVKYKGFTLIEILVGLLISGILLGIAVNVVSTVLSLGSMQNKNSKKNGDLLLIYSVLNKNFQSSACIQFNKEDDLTFYYPDKENVIVSFRDSYIIITQSLQPDTIDMMWHEMKISKINETLIEELSFIVINNSITYPFHFRKEYTAHELHNSERNAD